MNEQPWSERAEKSIIGASFIDSKIPGWLQLEPSEFHSMHWRAVWREMQRLNEQGTPIDEVTVVAALERAGIMDAVTFERLHSAVAEVPTAANVQHYADIVKKHRLTREVMLVSERIDHFVKSGDEGEELLGKVHQVVASLENSSTKSPAISLTEAVRTEARAILGDLEQKQAPGVPTGLRVLDRFIGGLPIGPPVILAARPSVGKSAVALQIAMNAGAAGYGVHILTLEDRITGFAQRVLAGDSKVSTSNLRRRQFESREERGRVLEAAEIRRDNVLVQHAHGMKAHQIIRAVRAERPRNKTRLVIVDFLQLVGPPSQRMSKGERVAANVEMLGEFAGTDELALLMLCQLSRANEKEARPPQLTDLRAAGEIEEVGKLILGLNPIPKSDDLEIWVLKNHQGPVGKLVVSFNRPFSRVS